jgi:hypothetical protein
MTRAEPGGGARVARIALLDSGVDPAHRAIAGRCTLTCGPGGDRDRLGHGTAVAAAILELCPGAALHSLQLFEREPSCGLDALLVALRAALAWRPDLINLSLGTSDPTAQGPLAQFCLEAHSLGVRIVAPATCDGLPSYPGMLDGVDGVIDDPNVQRLLPQQREQNRRTWWFSSPFATGTPPTRHVSGVSLATAWVTGHLARGQASMPRQA